MKFSEKALRKEVGEEIEIVEVRRWNSHYAIALLENGKTYLVPDNHYQQTAYAVDPERNWK